MFKQEKVSTKNQAYLFFALTYLFSWIIFFIGGQLELLPVILIGIWGPTLMSITLTLYFYGKEGLYEFLSRFKRFKIAWYWWLVLLFLPAAIHITGVSLWQLYSTGEVAPNISPMKYWLNAIIPSFIIAGFGEELGWRGFALPRLQRHFTPIKATLVLAFFHMFWHLPTYWLGQGIHNVPLVYIIGFVFPWTIIFNWLYNKSGGSLIFAVSFHAISNASLSIVRFMPLDREVPISPELITQIYLPADLAGPYLSVVAVYTLVALIILKFGNFKRVNTDILGNKNV